MSGSPKCTEQSGSGDGDSAVSGLEEQAVGDLGDEHHRQSAKALNKEHTRQAAGAPKRPLWLEQSGGGRKRQAEGGNLER